MKPEPPIALPVEFPRLLPIEFRLEGLSAEQATIRLQADGTWAILYHLTGTQSEPFAAALAAGNHLEKRSKGKCNTSPSPKETGSSSGPVSGSGW